MPAPKRDRRLRQRCSQLDQRHELTGASRRVRAPPPLGQRWQRRQRWRAEPHSPCSDVVHTTADGVLAGVARW